MGGTIRVDSKVGEGTRFQFDILIDEEVESNDFIIESDVVPSMTS